MFYALLLRHSREKSPRASPSVGMKVAEEKRGLVCAQYRVRQRASAGRDYTLNPSHLSLSQGDTPSLGRASCVPTGPFYPKKWGGGLTEVKNRPRDEEKCVYVWRERSLTNTFAA